MWLGYQKNTIVVTGDTREELENIPFLKLDRILKTDDRYILVGGEYVLESKAKRNKYAEYRTAEYPSIEKQLDMIYWDKINGTNIWETTITRIKKRYPKG